MINYLDSNKEINNEEEDHDTSNVIYVAAVIAALGGLLFGYDIGIISGAKIQIQKEMDFTCVQIEVIVAMLPVGAFVASLGGGKMNSQLCNLKCIYFIRYDKYMISSIPNKNCFS